MPSVARVGARCTTEPVFSHARRRPRRCRMGLGSLTYVGPGENVFLFIPNLIGYLRVVSRPGCCPLLAQQVHCTNRLWCCTLATLPQNKAGIQSTLRKRAASLSTATATHCAHMYPLNGCWERIDGRAATNLRFFFWYAFALRGTAADVGCGSQAVRVDAQVGQSRTVLPCLRRRYR